MGRPRYNTKTKREFDKVTNSTLYSRGEQFLSQGSKSRIWKNIYLYDWESDLFKLNHAGLGTEGEVKRTREDFWADFDKDEKHRKLSMRDGILPNEFYYIVPRGMVDLDEVPEYAGLVEVIQSKQLRGLKYTVKKRAPRLTNDPIPESWYRTLIWK